MLNVSTFRKPLNVLSIHPFTRRFSSYDPKTLEDNVEKVLKEHFKRVEARLKSLNNKIIFLGLVMIITGWELRKDIREMKTESQQNICRLIEENRANCNRIINLINRE